MPVPRNRNSAGKGSMGFNLVGAVCVVTGIQLSRITRINLLTGHTSSPYIAVGIPLAVVGIIVVVVTQWTAKKPTPEEQAKRIAMPTAAIQGQMNSQSAIQGSGSRACPWCAETIMSA